MQVRSFWQEFRRKLGESNWEKDNKKTSRPSTIIVEHWIKFKSIQFIYPNERKGHTIFSKSMIKVLLILYMWFSSFCSNWTMERYPLLVRCRYAFNSSIVALSCCKLSSKCIVVASWILITAALRSSLWVGHWMWKIRIVKIVALYGTMMCGVMMYTIGYELMHIVQTI